MSPKTMKILRIVFIVLSMLTAVGSILLGPTVVSEKGEASIIYFESFYVYVVVISIALCSTFANKDSSLLIVLAIFTYAWTYFLINEAIAKITKVNASIGVAAYVYLASSIFLIPAFLFNNKKQENNKTTLENKNNTTDTPDKDQGAMIENNILFTNFLRGIKGIPFDTEVLLVNNVPNHTLDLIYNLTNQEKDNQTINYSIANIKNISSTPKVRMENTAKEVKENRTKSILLSAALFGNSPLLMMAGAKGFNTIFDSLSNNYEKVNYNSYFEITIEVLNNNQPETLVFTTNINPDVFIKQINNK